MKVHIVAFIGEISLTFVDPLRSSDLVGDGEVGAEVARVTENYEDG